MARSPTPTPTSPIPPSQAGGSRRIAGEGGRSSQDHPYPLQRPSPGYPRQLYPDLASHLCRPVRRGGSRGAWEAGGCRKESRTGEGEAGRECGARGGGPGLKRAWGRGPAGGGARGRPRNAGGLRGAVRCSSGPRRGRILEPLPGCCSPLLEPGRPRPRQDGRQPGAGLREPPGTLGLSGKTRSWAGAPSGLRGLGGHPGSWLRGPGGRSGRAPHGCCPRVRKAGRLAGRGAERNVPGRRTQHARAPAPRPR